MKKQETVQFESGVVPRRGRILPKEAEVQSNVAWFKLAEFMRRGEKERALSLYRLLIHSISDEPFLKKLEADIWFLFSPKKSETYYHEAAHAYLKADKKMEALFIFELLAQRYPMIAQYYEQVIGLIDQLNDKEKKKNYQKKLYQVHLKNGQIEKGLVLFKELEEQLKDADIFAFHKLLVLEALKHKYAEQKVIKTSLLKALDGLVRTGQKAELQQFLSIIEELNQAWHKDAVAYLAS